VDAIRAAVCIDVSALLHSCSIMSCSGLPGLCEPLRSDSNTIAVCRCNYDIFYGVRNTNGIARLVVVGVIGRGSTLRYANTIAGSSGTSPVPRNAL
jgi:hypothetical protein